MTNRTGTARAPRPDSRAGGGRRLAAPAPTAWWPPPFGLAVAGSLGVIVVLVWAGTGAHGFGSLAFFLAAAAVAGYVAAAARMLADGRPPLAAGRRVVLLVVVVLVPLVLDLHAYANAAAPGLAVVTVGAALVVGLWAIQLAGGGPGPRWRNGLHWPVLAFVAWMVVSTLTSSSPLVSLFGAFGFYDGLILIVASALLFFAVAADFDMADLKALISALYLGCGGLVVFYGLLQMHDIFTTFGGRWDWGPRGFGSFDTSRNIWSTLGNPNFLSGFLVVLLPLGVVLALLSPSRRTRLAIAGVSAGAVIELIQATTRGAWIAAVVSLALAGVLLFRDVVMRRRRAVLLGVVVLAAVVGLTALLSSAGKTRYGVSTVASGSGSAANTASERIELWRAALQIARDHPLVGTGPDTYADVVLKYQSAKLVRLAGADLNVDGPHNVFLEYLATLGIPGLVFFSSVLVLAAVRVRHARRSLRERAMRTGGQDRMLIAGIGAALTAWVVQAAFDVNTIPLTVIFWMLLGLLALMTDGAIAEPVNAARVVTTRSGKTGTRSRANPPRRANRGRGSKAARRGTTVRQWVVGAVVALAVGGVTVAAMGPDLAGRALHRGVGYQIGVEQSLAAKDTQTAFASYLSAVQAFRHASRLQPWDPTVLEARADFLFASAHPSTTDRSEALQTAEALLRRVISLQPGNARAKALLADVLHEAATAQSPEPLAQETALLRQAVALNLYEPSYAIDLSRVQIASGSRDQALSTIRRALTYAPNDKLLLDAQQKIKTGGDPAAPPIQVVAASGLSASGAE